MSAPEVPFCFPIKRLENSRLILEPFDFVTHAELFVQGTKDHPELFTYVAQKPAATTTAFDEAFYSPRIRSSDTETLFAILAKSETPNSQAVFAGVIGFLNTSPLNASTEIGFITIFPAFQRTFVTSNAVGLLLLYALDLPPHGLGLRRCVWQNHAANKASRRVAERMGFTFEGVQRFQRVVPAGKLGNGFDTSCLPDVTGRNLGASRDSAVLAHYCDEWPEKRKDVVAIMERR